MALLCGNMYQYHVLSVRWPCTLSENIALNDVNIKGHREISVWTLSWIHNYSTYLEVIKVLPTVRVEYIDTIMATEHEGALIAASYPLIFLIYIFNLLPITSIILI